MVATFKLQHVATVGFLEPKDQIPHLVGVVVENQPFGRSAKGEISDGHDPQVDDHGLTRRQGHELSDLGPAGKNCKPPVF